MKRRHLLPLGAAIAGAFGLRRASAAPLAGWQAIETAPKGRKVIAGYFNRVGKWRTITARYYPANTLPNDDWDAEDDYAPAGWYEESETHETLLLADEPPTHWMPLPAPPVST